jgi:hypothetical protein
MSETYPLMVAKDYRRDGPRDQRSGGGPAAAGGPGGSDAARGRGPRLLARGLSNKAIAAELVVSPKTLGHHIQHIYRKIGSATRAAASLFAMQHGLLPKLEPALEDGAGTR